MRAFTFENATKIYFGGGCVKEHLLEAVKPYGETVMLAYGGGSIKTNGIYQEVMDVLKLAGKQVIEFSGIMPNPTYSKVMEWKKVVQENQVDLILAVGGGSVMDCSKAISMAAATDKDVWEEYWIKKGEIDFEPVPEIRRIPLDVPDPGCAFDADTQEEFQKLRDWERKRPVPDKEECERLLAWFHTPEATVRHSRAVAELAVELADRVLKHRAETCVEMTYKSPPIDKHKIYAAALLHDIAKAYPEHPETGAGWLRLLGHTGIADIVADHMDLPEEKLGYLNESLIVYLADKQVQGERRVTIEERFAAKREKFKDNPEALAGVERRYQLAKRAEALL